MMQIKEKAVDDFLDALASSSATPGGGSAAAILGAMGAALVSMVMLVIVAAFCFIGPLFNQHGYAEVYPSYVAVPPSLSPYPHEDTLQPVMQLAVERGRARDDFGLYHEVFLVPRSQFESIYLNCGPVGVATFGVRGEPVGPLTTGRDRLGRRIPRP